MMKEQMIKDVTVKVLEVIEAKDAVFNFVDEIEETVAELKATVRDLEQQVQAQKESLTMAQDLGEAKLIKQQINSLEEDIELTKSVAEAKTKAMYAELEDKAEAFFKVHKSVTFLFGTLDNYMVLNTSLSELAETKQTMTGFANSLNGAFAGVRQVLLDTKIVAVEDQNKRYRGYHLGQRGQQTKLDTFEYKVKPYMNELRAYGLSI